MTYPLVSVVVPIFNQAALCIGAIESICSQTYRNLQIIAVDDGSSDNSACMLENHFGDKITVLRQVNSGPSAAINLGLQVAQGEFIMLMGGDDLSTPDRIAHQLEFFRCSDYDIVFARPLLIDEAGRTLEDSHYPVFFRSVEPGRSIFHSLFFEDNFLCAPSAMLKADVVARIGKFHEGLVQLQDYDYWLRACGQGLRLGISDHRVVAYRRHIGNLSSEARASAAVAEIPYVLSRTLDRAQPDSLRITFRHMLAPSLDTNKPLSRFEKSLLLLAHPRAEVRTAGLAAAMDIFEDSVCLSEIADKDINLFRYIFNSMANH